MFHTYVYVQFFQPQKCNNGTEVIINMSKSSMTFWGQNKVCVLNLCSIEPQLLRFDGWFVMRRRRRKVLHTFFLLFSLLSPHMVHATLYCNILYLLQYTYMAWIKSKSFSKNLYAHQQITSNNHQKTMNQNQVMYHLQTLFFLKNTKFLFISKMWDISYECHSAT